MPNDHYGNAISIGDTIAFVVGIPGREVVGTVTRHRGRLIVANDEGRMTLYQVLRYFDCKVLKREQDV